MEKLKVIELFSGIGSQSKALKNIGIDYEIVAIADWDIYANISYAAIHHDKELKESIKKFDLNFGFDLNNQERERERERERLLQSLDKHILSRDSKTPITTLKRFDLRTLFILNESLRITNNFTDINAIKGNKLPNHNMITYSFPCQDLSLQGSQRGLHEGKSSSMLWQVERIIKELNEENKLPKYLLLENVKSLFSKKYKKGFNNWEKTLEKLGYTNHKFTLNSKYFDVPQNRERAFMFSELNQNKFVPPSIDNKKITSKNIGDFLDDDFVEWKLPKGKVLNWFPKRNAKGLAKTSIEGYTTFMSEASAFGRNSISPTITATGALNRIKVIEKENTLRLLTSKEQWQLMGFTKSDWEKVNKLNVVPESNLKKQAGNSIVVQVLEVIFSNVK